MEVMAEPTSLEEAQAQLRSAAQDRAVGASAEARAFEGAQCTMLSQTICCSWPGDFAKTPEYERFLALTWHFA